MPPRSQPDDQCAPRANRSAGLPPRLRAWADCRIDAVVPGATGHVLHSYFNHCPESPDGRRVLYFSSTYADAQLGDLRWIDRASGESRLLWADLEVQDAHRQANQQWVCGGRAVLVMCPQDEGWAVWRIDAESAERERLAVGRQVFWGQPQLDEVPLYGPYWAPGAHRDLELLDVTTGAVRTALTIDQVIADHADFVADTFGDARPDSIAFPVLSPDGQRVFFKLSRVGDGSARSDAGSVREGLFVYDLVSGRALGVYPSWGHPAWMPDSRRILRQHVVIDTDDMSTSELPWYPQHANSHAAPSPDGHLLAIDIARDRFTARELHWAVVVGDLAGNWVTIHTDPAERHGTTSWRPVHPHPVFSADGARIYFNANLGARVELRCATVGDAH